MILRRPRRSLGLTVGLLIGLSSLVSGRCAPGKEPSVHADGDAQTDVAHVVVGNP